jgi:hypothetical protein
MTIRGAGGYDRAGDTRHHKAVLAFEEGPFSRSLEAWSDYPDPEGGAPVGVCFRESAPVGTNFACLE